MGDISASYQLRVTRRVPDEPEAGLNREHKRGSVALPSPTNEDIAQAAAEALNGQFAGEWSVESERLDR